MPVEINGKIFCLASELIKELNITRQTLWRWRREGKIPQGYRHRAGQVLFSQEEANEILNYAHRLEPIDNSSAAQMKLFDRAIGS